MKTLKKALSVVLALAMVLGMVAVASAAPLDVYTDKADVTDKEAVEVLTAVGVLKGSNGKVEPKANVTRSQAAKLVAYLMLGEEVAEALPAVQVFSDVPSYNWAAKYVAYCYNEGIIAGVGNGKFNPDGNVTGYEFGKMLLMALGFDCDKEGLVGSSWAIKSAKLMKEVKLVNTKTAKKANLALTREEAARYCLNALKASVVEYGYGGGVVEVTSETTLVYLGSNNENVASATGETLMHVLYGTDLTVEKINDSFGRPANLWKYTKLADKNSNKTIGTYVSDDYLVSFTKGLTQGELFDAIVAAGGTFKEVEASKQTADYVELHFTYVNGVPVATTDAAVKFAYTLANGATIDNASQYYYGFAEKGSTADVVNYHGDQMSDNATIFEVYKIGDDKNNNGIYNVIVIDEFCGKVTAVKNAVEKTGKERYITIDPADPLIPDKVVKSDKFEKDDMVTFNLAAGVAKNVTATTTVTGKLTANNSLKKTVVIAGTTYEYVGETAPSVTTTEETFYLDQYGYVLGQKGAAVGDKTCAVTASYYALNEKNQMVAKVDVILSDGTTATWEVEAVPGIYELVDADLVGEVFSYAKSTKGVYTLGSDLGFVPGTADPAYGEGEFTSQDLLKNVKQYGGYYFASDIKTIVLDSEADNVATVYEGAKAFSGCDIAIALEWHDDNSDGDIDAPDELYIKAIYITSGDVDSSELKADSLIYVYNKVGDASVTINNSTKDYYTYTAYVDGEKVEGFMANNYQAPSTIANGDPVNLFFKNAVDETTGAYKLGEDYHIATAGVDVCVYTEKSVQTVKEGGILVIAAVDDFSGLTDAKIVDVANTGIDTVDELKTATGVKVSFIYDGNDNSLVWVYVIAGTRAN